METCVVVLLFYVPDASIGLYLVLLYVKNTQSIRTQIAFVSLPESTLKRKLEDVSRDLPEANSCKEIVLSTHFGTPQEYNSSEPMHCLGIVMVFVAVRLQRSTHYTMTLTCQTG